MALTKVNSILVDGAINTDSSGNVGIGTVSPSTKLNVYGSSPSIYLEQNSGVAGNTQLRLNAAGGANTASVRLIDKYIWTSTTNGAKLNIGNDLSTVQVTIDDVGRMWSGSGSPWTQGSGGIKSFAFYGGSDFPITGASDSIVAIFNRITGTGTIVELKYNAGVVGTITTNGSTVAYNTSSDYRLKENIAPMTGALEKVSALKPVTYTWKSTGQNDQGFIAHQLAEVCPQAVTGEKDATELVDIKDDDGNVIGQETKPVYQGIDTSFLVATLTAAIQEQQAIITDLKARIETLEAK
jgi:hypothetical protein